MGAFRYGAFCKLSFFVFTILFIILFNFLAVAEVLLPGLLHPFTAFTCGGTLVCVNSIEMLSSSQLKPTNETPTKVVLFMYVCVYV